MRKTNLLDIFLSLIILALVVSGCFSPELIPDPTLETPQPGGETVPGPRLRIQNSGSFDIENLTVRFPDSSIHFGDVPAGATTDYMSAPRGVYNYAAYTFTHKGQQITQPVVDWIGESPRPGESFTYVIDYDPARQEMQLIRLVSVLDQ